MYNIIVPSCSDLNRGDQALAWEVEQISKECGFKGDYYFMAENNEPIDQSIQHGLKVIRPILEHPGRKYKNKNNLEYTTWLKVKWGIVALIDTFTATLLLLTLTRSIAYPFMRKETKKSLRLFKHCNALFVKGGGFIHAYGGITSTYYIFFSLYHIFLAQALKKPVYIFPNSIGPFEGPGVKWLVKKALKNCKFISTRETISQQMIKEELGISVPNYPDLAFFLPNAIMKKDVFLDQYDIPKDKKLVAITMRPHRFPKSKNPVQDYTKFKKSMSSFIIWLYDKGYMPVLIEHVHAVNYNENDGECIKEVCQLIPKNKYIFVSNQKYTCIELKTIYSFFNYIIGTRFHSMIFSMSNGVPGIAITYTGNKGQGIMHDMKLDNYYISIDELNFSLLKSKFNELLENEAFVKGQIKTYQQLLKTELSKLKESIRS